jgi:hypothetical protein
VSIDAISGSSALSAALSDQQSQRRVPAMTNTAELLGISSSQLSTELRSGETLSELASQQGVSSTSLISSIESDIQANAPQGAPTLSSAQLAQMANGIANGTAPQGPVGGTGGSGAAGLASQLTGTASLLGISTSTLASDLQSGTTLSQLASAKGVSSTSLLSSIESDLSSNAPQGAPALSSTQLAQIASDIANGTPPGATSPDTTTDSSSTAASTTADQNLASLAQTLGVAPSTLLAELTSGTGISTTLQSTNGSGYGTSASDSYSGGVAFDEYV